MIMDRKGMVIRSTGSMLRGQEGQVVLRRYAGEVWKLVEATSTSVGKLEVDVSPSPSEGERADRLQDDLRFLRIRTRQHELMITPGPSPSLVRRPTDGVADDRFVLVVVQDPTKA